MTTTKYLALWLSSRPSLYKMFSCFDSEISINRTSSYQMFIIFCWSDQLFRNVQYCQWFVQKGIAYYCQTKRLLFVSVWDCWCAVAACIFGRLVIRTCCRSTATNLFALNCRFSAQICSTIAQLNHLTILFLNMKPWSHLGRER